MPPVSAESREVKNENSETVLWRCQTCSKIFSESDEDSLEKHLMVHPVQFYPKQNIISCKSSLDFEVLDIEAVDLEFTDLLDFDQEESLQRPSDSLWSSILNYTGDLGGLSTGQKPEKLHDDPKNPQDETSGESFITQNCDSHSPDSGYDEIPSTYYDHNDDSMDINQLGFQTHIKIHDKRDTKDINDALKSGKRSNNLGSESPIKKQKTCEVTSSGPLKVNLKLNGFVGHFGQNHTKNLAVEKCSLHHHEKETNSKPNQTSKKKKASSRTNPYENKEVLKEIANMQILVNSNNDHGNRELVQMIAESLEITYKHRFHEIFALDMSIYTVMSTYPGLKIPEMLAQEFERTTKRDYSALERKIKELVLPVEQHKFLENLPSEDCFAKLLQTAQAAESVNLLDFQMACMLYNYSKKVPERKFFLFRKKSDDPRLYIATPNIDILGELGKSAVFTVYCEMTKVSEVSSFYRAIMIVYCLYWIFHLEYQECVAPFFEVFDKY